MRNARWGSFAVVLAMVAISGCANRDVNAPLVAAVKSPIADVPVPVGFEMTGDSTSQVTPGKATRVVDHRYKGNDGILPVAKFFRDKLPEKGWLPVELNQSKGNEIVDHYVKGNESLVVTVSPGSWNATYVRIKIDPANGQ